ncbi:MAG: T9SS type A sorting domain-containing protein [Bacteroidota bacterium]
MTGSIMIDGLMQDGILSIKYKNEELVPANTKITVLPTISQLYQLSGKAGDALNIRGTGFSSDANQLVVKIGDVQVPIFISNLQSIIVTITADVKTGRVSVTKAGHTALSVDPYAIHSYDEFFCPVLPPKPVISKKQDGSYTLTSSSEGGNEWFLDGDIISGQPGKALTPRVSGSYSVLVNIDGCRSDMSDPVTVELPEITGLGDDPGFTDVYPNPFDSKLSINLSGYSNPVYIKLYNVQGALVLEDESFGETTLQLNTASLPPGLFLLTIKSGDRVITKKVIKK